MKRIISFILALLMFILSLSSCDLVEDIQHLINNTGGDNDKLNEDIRDPNPGGYNGELKENIHYHSVKTLFSYDDVMDALTIVRQRRNVEPTYTVKDMGEDYTIFYRFLVNNSWTEYPIDYDTYFNTKSDGYFTTYIFFENQGCSYEEHYPKHTNSYFSYKEDEDDEIITIYRKENACITVSVPSDCSVQEIEWKMNLSYSVLYPEYFDQYGQFAYTIRHRGIIIMNLYSCVELDDAFFDLFFDSLVTTSVKE